ncbi:MAG: dienelactone hydrolase family protein [Alphaproteobacteria bacterium]|nr:dienelactone hydrolase family protein [Alphaproteobacteria bacterium]
MSNNFVTIKAHDGQDFEAYIAFPEKTPAPVVILIQEIFGINHEMREKCDAMAAKGYIALCPDLFWRIEPGIHLTDRIPEQLERAFTLFGQFDQEQGLEDLRATLAHARAMKECAGPVTCIGYCLGGKLAYMMAARTDIDATVSYYGVGLGTMLEEADKITTPLLLHIAGEDEYVPKNEQADIQSTMLEHPTAELYVYPGMSHAFARGEGLHYNEQAAQMANKRTDAFLTAALANPALTAKNKRHAK